MLRGEVRFNDSDSPILGEGMQEVGNPTLWVYAEGDDSPVQTSWQEPTGDMAAKYSVEIDQEVADHTGNEPVSLRDLLGNGDRLSVSSGDTMTRGTVFYE